MKRLLRRAAYLLLFACAAHASQRSPAAGQGAAAANSSALPEAQNQYNTGQYNRAVDTATAAAAKDPNDSQAAFLLGQCFYQLRDYSRAVTNFERAVQLSANTSKYHDWLGRAYGRRAEEGRFLGALGEARRAHKEFEQAVELDEHNFEAQRDLIRYETYAPGIASGGDDRALKNIDALEKIDPTQGRLARGEFLGAKKRFPEADALFAKILESKPDSIGVYFEVAEYFRDREDTRQMTEAVQAAQSLGPNDRRLPYYRGVLLVLNHGNPVEAERLLRSYVGSVPDDADLPSHASAREWLGKLFESQERFSEAALEYRRALELDPHNKDLSDALKRVERK
jgi:tetratricopeptide (TPR) repeat protein